MSRCVSAAKQGRARVSGFRKFSGYCLHVDLAHQVESSGSRKLKRIGFDLNSAPDIASFNILPNFAKPTRLAAMSTMNISLPDSLKEFVDRQVSTAGYGTSSEYVRELIRRDQERTQLRNLLLEGAQSRPSGLADADYFASLRSGIKKRLAKSR